MTLVLLVEDDENLRGALTTVLTGDGYRVSTAEDGRYAMIEIARERPDIIVSDVMMPHMDGVALVLALLAVPSLSSIPVVMTSAGARRPNVPVHAFLSKPFSALQLLTILRALQQP
ncbi:CheY-like chemotaxis protein [Paraburkholderia sp. GAS199]|uniref:response regulator n=1 Tax=Paraburkholderia sp. GAS199 TaxID=3035126 RepID=UPI003D1F1E55